jgi:hypothetical protein
MNQLLPLAILLFCSISLTFAQSPIDSTFAQTGIIHFDFGSNAQSIAFAVVTAPNMTAYSAIAKEQNGSQSIHVRSHLANGSVNTSFAQNGDLELFLPPGTEIIELFMHYTSDNHIIGLANVYNDVISAYGYMMTKITSSGAPVLSFGTNGVVEQLISNYWIQVNGFAADDQQNIYVYGARENEDMQSPVFDYPFIAKHQSNGQVDMSFGGNGIFDFGLLFNGEIQDLVINDNDNLIAMGVNFDLDQEVFLAAINASGNIFPDFGTAGFTSISVAGANMEPAGLYLTSNGNINVVLQGIDFTAMENTVVLYQFNANGLPNVTFGNGGMSSALVGSELQFIYAFTGLPDNGIVTSNIIIDLEEEVFYSRIIKLNADGSLDSTFGEGGIFEFVVDNTDLIVVSLHAASEEKLYVSGATLEFTTESTQGFIARLNLKPEVTNISTPLSDKLYEILVYPNPATDFISVSINNMKLTEATLQLIDLSGRTVFSTSADFSFDSMQTIQIPETLPGGLYYIGLKSAEGIPVYKPVQVIR